MSDEAEPPSLPIPADTLDTLTEMMPTLRIKQDADGFVHRLPPEIMSEIFSRCIPPFRPYQRGRPNSSLILGEVCTSWRAIAEATPDLWTSMTIDLHFKSDQRVLNYLPLITEWLRRSRSLPVSIRILGQRSSYHWMEETSKRVMDCIAECSNRWQDVDLRLSASCYQYLPSGTSVLPHLQSLLIERCQTSGARGVEWKLDLTSTAPELKDLTLVRVYLSTIQVNWGFLTRIEICQFYVDECCKVFSLATNLVHCVIRVIVPGDDGHGIPPHPIISPHLQTLDWRFDSVQPMKAVLVKLVTPVLTHLRLISGYGSPSTLPYPQVRSFLERTVSSLTTFMIGNHEPMEESLLLDMWECSPILTIINVTHLDLRKQWPPLTLELPSQYTHPTAARWDEVDHLLPALQGFQ